MLSNFSVARSFTSYTEPATKGSVQISNKADQSDLAYNFEKAKILAENGEEIKIRPHVEGAGKNPELELRNSQLADFKVDMERTTIEKFVRNSIDSANGQMANPVLVIKNDRYDKIMIGKLCEPN